MHSNLGGLWFPNRHAHSFGIQYSYDVLCTLYLCSIKPWSKLVAIYTVSHRLSAQKNTGLIATQMD